MAALLLLALVAPLVLTVPGPVRPGLAALPRIAWPADTAQRRINLSLAQLDARAKAAERDCRADSVNPASWSRTVAVTMRGPIFLSYVVTDEVDCGGAHPSEGHAAIVYDLATGKSVDWAPLLGGRLTGAMPLAAGADGVQVVTLWSPRLRALRDTL